LKGKRGRSHRPEKKERGQREVGFEEEVQSRLAAYLRLARGTRGRLETSSTEKRARKKEIMPDPRWGSVKKKVQVGNSNR